MRKRFLVLALAWILYPTAGWPCGVEDVCSDTSANFGGVIHDTGFRLDWSTDDENSTIHSYRLVRYDVNTCQTYTSCGIQVARIYPAGSCGTNQPYSYEDSPGSGSWTYVLEVWTTGGSSPACYTETTP